MQKPKTAMRKERPVYECTTRNRAVGGAKKGGGGEEEQLREELKFDSVHLVMLQKGVVLLLFLLLL